ncbi:GNAT family N-acetyltransferase [Alkalihalobacillus sp. MEB203]|uniref:GNAT family N-acetyltransferase n=1 Tax=Alkalihalobacterium chitinilyticum TaxID=2980103 RepID=A0ABT5V9P6_9BACI|nr:GNAT family N-acetyltransferase [Alkalihalobacterium chitinilyticum]MDE5412177.1 GNAT family N-acetyltransferase [Alkalihalobacterium chitinilyticum]
MLLLKEKLQTIETFTAKDGTQVTIRPATTKDSKGIVHAVSEIVSEGTFLQKESVRTDKEEKQFIHEMQENGNMYVVVDINGKISGLARVIRSSLEMKKHTGLFRTWLTTDAQGKGIGKKLMAYTLNWCQKEQLHKLCLTVFSSNQIAVDLYEKAGFVVEGVQKEQVCLKGTYDDEVLMAYFFNSGGEKK